MQSSYHVQRTDGSLAQWSGPGTGHIVAWLGGDGTPVQVVCQTTGPTEDGLPYTVWDKLGDGTYVYDYYVDTPGDSYHPALATCPGSPGQTPPTGAGGAIVAGGGGVAGTAPLAVIPVGPPGDSGSLATWVQSVAASGQRIVDGGGNGWGNPNTLPGHYADHGGDFGSPDADSYAREAQQFFQRAVNDHLPTKVGDDNVIRVYEPSTNTFGVYNSDGTTATYYKPTAGQRYWDRITGRDPWAKPTTGGGDSGDTSSGDSTGGDSTGGGNSAADPAGGDGTAPDPDVPDLPDIPDLPFIF